MNSRLKIGDVLQVGDVWMSVSYPGRNRYESIPEQFVGVPVSIDDKFFRPSRGYIPIPEIRQTDELKSLGLLRGQWIKLEWCDRPSRFDRCVMNGDKLVSVVAYHYPRASTVYWSATRKQGVRPLVISSGPAADSFRSRS